MRQPKPKPIRRPQKGVISKWRIPDEGYIIPRLKPGNERTEAIGFLTLRTTEEIED